MHSKVALQLQRVSPPVECLGNGLSGVLTKQDSIELAAGILPVFYPNGGLFFMEGQPASGVFLLRSGKVKESIASNKGKTAIVRVAGPGDILGLSAVLAGDIYQSSAETLQPTHADFMRKAPFLRLLNTSAELAKMVATQLSRNCKEAYDSIRCFGLCASVSERVACLLLQWAECPLTNVSPNTVGIKIRVPFTHEEMAQFVGSTRETMSRVLAEFRRRKWLSVAGSVWTIVNEGEIRRVAAM
jgi:CRP/FNR family transcriptional regulator, cyclic AMP receptor protein